MIEFILHVNYFESRSDPVKTHTVARYRKLTIVARFLFVFTVKSIAIFVPDLIARFHFTFP